MLDSSQPWSLFGFDLRGTAHYIKAGWSDFLWGDESPVLPVVDEPVQAHLPDGSVRWFCAGKPCGAPENVVDVHAQAVVLPDRLSLVKTLSLPAAAEANLQSALALEVNASSPFPPEDTCFGWRILDRGEHQLSLAMVISSRSAVMTEIAGRFDSHDAEACEVWALVDDAVVQLGGFGEAARAGRNRQRLIRMATIAAYCLAVVVACFALAAGAKYLELQKVEEIAAEVERSAEDALGMREDLAVARSMLTAANDLLVSRPFPQAQLYHLADKLGNETWVSSIDVKGRSMRIEGQSRDASQVMQQLLNDPAYSSVEAPVAFKKLRSGHERFVLDLELAASAQDTREGDVQ